MSQAEQLYQESFPHRTDDYEIDTSFHTDALVLRRWDLIEDSWRDFLDINEASNHIPARAASAINWAQHINHQLAEQGLDGYVHSDAAIMPVLLNSTINYMAHKELLTFYRGKETDKTGLGRDDGPHRSYIDAERHFRGEVADYLSLFQGRSKPKAYDGLASTLDYASLVTLGPGVTLFKKASLHKHIIERGIPDEESRARMRPYANVHNLFRNQSA